MSDPFVKVIAHSLSPDNIPLITIHARYWRAIHAEVMTHRVFSRNARSSRAVPTTKMLDEILNDPFIPRHWGKNQKGMQADEECNSPVILNHYIDEDFTPIESTKEEAWLIARDSALHVASAFGDAGYHKQVVNRLVEPFMWIDTLITSTQWNNFFMLRDHKDAEPHMRDLAVLAKEAINASTPRQVGHYNWHIPYVSNEELVSFVGEGPGDSEIYDGYEIACMVSAARCARISYAPFDGNSSIEKELERYKLLTNSNPIHASPVEHQATPDYFDDKYKQWTHPEEHRNFHGWRQFRAQIPNETSFDSFIQK
jgi:hypothetical protein